MMNNNQRTFVFCSAVSGNILEYFDFTLYTIFLLQLGKSFFPAGESEFVQVLSSSVVFAIGFLGRPVGGILFGYIGDKYGRRKSLILSMLGMTLPTLLIAAIPTYNQIGYLAPVILVLARLTQGLCISGEGAGAAIFVLEHYHNLKPGFVTGIVHGSNTAGILLASLVGILIDHYFYDFENAWRLAFLLGGVMGFAGLYFRIKVSETPMFSQLLEKKHTLKVPLLEVIKVAKPHLFITFCVGGVTSSVVYLLKNINNFSRSVLHLDNTTSLYYLFYSSCILMVAMPIFGSITDVLGRVRVIIFSSIAIIITTIPILYLMSSVVTWHQILALTLLGVLAGSISGAAYVFVISLFPPEQRFSGVAFSYNSGIAVFGGTTPTITLWLSKVMKNGEYATLSHIAPAFYIMTMSTIFLFIIYFMRSWIQDVFR